VFSDPRINLDQFDIHPGMTVADFGSGMGHYALAVAKLVGDTGRVYALDIQKEIVESLAREAQHQHIRNLDTMRVDLEKSGGSNLRSHTIDRVLLINILFQVKNKQTIIQEIARILRPTGKVLMIDWTDSPRGIGPPPTEAISEMSAKELFEENGFTLHKPIMAGVHHYGLIFSKV